MLKRLSRVEYQNTINDVFGTDFSLLDQLPMDNIDAGFDNNADNLHLSRVDMESYFKVANRIAESVVSDKPSPREVVYSTKSTDIDTHSHKDNTNGFAPSLALASRPLVFASQSIQIKINPSVITMVFIESFPRGSLSRPKFVPGNRVQERLPAVTEITEVDTNDTHSNQSFDELCPAKEFWSRAKHCECSPQNAGWKEFDLSEGFITQLSSTDTIVLRCNLCKWRWFSAHVLYRNCDHFGTCVRNLASKDALLQHLL